MTTPPKNDFRFNYSKYKSSSIPLEHIDDIRKTAIQPATNIITQAFLLVRVLVLVGCEWLRMRKINEEMLIEKQAYESGKVQQSSGTLAEDDIDQLRDQVPGQRGINEVDT